MDQRTIALAGHFGLQQSVTQKLADSTSRLCGELMNDDSKTIRLYPPVDPIEQDDRKWDEN